MPHVDKRPFEGSAWEFVSEILEVIIKGHFAAESNCRRLLAKEATVFSAEVSSVGANQNLAYELLTQFLSELAQVRAR